MLAGCLLPYCGFGLSALVAFILRQPPARILTIAIETGIQNTGLAIVIMKFSLPQPEADLAVVAPIVVAMFMPLPLWVAVTVTEIRRRCCHQRHQAQKDLNIELAGTTESPNADRVSVDGLLSSNKSSINGCKTADKSVINGHHSPVDIVQNGDAHATKL
jgi:sodium/bile acid cotransporter 3/5